MCKHANFHTNADYKGNTSFFVTFEYYQKYFAFPFVGNTRPKQ